MHKRMEFYVRNPGYEGTESAMGTHTIDFEDQESYGAARRIVSRVGLPTNTQSLFEIENERGEVLALNPDVLVSYRMFDVADDWHPVFSLPPGGKPAPPREQD
jgi:hypothetical protein